MPVKKVCDLAFKGEDMLKLGMETDGNFMEYALDQILEKVLNKELPNEYEPLKDFVFKLKEEFACEEIEPKDTPPKEEEEEDIERDFSHGLFTDSDFEEPKEEPAEEEKPEEDSTYREYEEYAKNQELLEKRVKELELDNLRKDLEIEISRKIKQNGILDGLVGQMRDKTEETLHKVHYDILINEEKYKLLKEKDDLDDKE